MGIKKIATLSQDCFSGAFEFFEIPLRYLKSQKTSKIVSRRRESFFVRAPHIRLVFKGLLVYKGHSSLETA